MSLKREVSELLQKYCVHLDENPVAKKAGDGAFAEVYKSKLSGAHCAVKKLRGILLGSGNYEAVDDLSKHALMKKFVKEIKFLKNQRHPNIVQFLGVCTLDPAKPMESVALVMEHMEASIKDLISTDSAYSCRLSLGAKISILKDTACGVSHLHSQDIIHRDLNPGNVLLTPSLQAKVADLGVACKLQGKLMSSPFHMSMVPGTIDFMPPESKRPHPSYGLKLDCFSFGHLALLLLIEDYPQLLYPREWDSSNSDKSTDNSEILRRHDLFTRVEDCCCCDDQRVIHLIKSCLNNSPDNRPSMNDIRKKLDIILLCIDYEPPSLVLKRRQQVWQKLRELEARIYCEKTLIKPAPPPKPKRKSNSRPSSANYDTPPISNTKGKISNPPINDKPRKQTEAFPQQPLKRPKDDKKRLHSPPSGASNDVTPTIPPSNHSVEEARVSPQQSLSKSVPPQKPPKDVKRRLHSSLSNEASNNVLPTISPSNHSGKQVEEARVSPQQLFSKPVPPKKPPKSDNIRRSHSSPSGAGNNITPTVPLCNKHNTPPTSAMQGQASHTQLRDSDHEPPGKEKQASRVSPKQHHELPKAPQISNTKGKTSHPPINDTDSKPGNQLGASPQQPSEPAPPPKPSKQLSDIRRVSPGASNNVILSNQHVEHVSKSPPKPATKAKTPLNDGDCKPLVKARVKLFEAKVSNPQQQSSKRAPPKQKRKLDPPPSGAINSVIRPPSNHSTSSTSATVVQTSHTHLHDADYNPVKQASPQHKSAIQQPPKPPKRDHRRRLHSFPSNGTSNNVSPTVPPSNNHNETPQLSEFEKIKQKWIKRDQDSKEKDNEKNSKHLKKL